MSLYLEFKVKTKENNVTSGISYHRQLGLLAILSYSQNGEAQILICDELVSTIFHFNCASVDFIIPRVKIYTTLSQMCVKDILLHFAGILPSALWLLAQILEKFVYGMVD